MTEEEKKKKQYTGYTSGKFTPSNSYTQKKAAYDNHVAAKPAAYENRWQKSLDDTMSKIVNRKPFEYDVNSDTLYNQYKDIYTRNASTAMADTVAKASTMTGGYGNSYAVSAGNVAYNEQMDKLNDIVPELYERARAQYVDEGNALLDQYSMYADMEAREYDRYRTGVNDWMAEREYLAGEVDRQYNKDYAEWSDAEDRARSDYWDNTNFEYTVGRDTVADARYADETAYNHQRDAYNKLFDTISMTGYIPTDAELTAAGMTRAEADAIRSEHGRDVENDTYNRQQDAYHKLFDTIGMTGYIPTDAELAAAGMTRAEAEAIRNEYNRGVKAEEDELAYEHEQDDKPRELESIYMKAQLGDYKPFADYYGLSLAQAAEYWETGKANASLSSGTEYTSGDVIVATNKLESGQTLTANDYDALLYAGYSPEELDSIASDGVTSGLADELYTLASEYGRGLKGDIPLKRAVMLVHEAGDTDAAKETFRELFGDEVYNKHFGVASQAQVSTFVKQMVNQIPTKERFTELGYDMGGKYSYAEFVEEVLAQAVAAHNMTGEDAVIALMLVEEREGI